MLKRLSLAAAALVVGAAPALAHVGAGATASFAAGVHHPLSGLDHMTVMVAVGLWAALKGGRALWAWPCSFVGVMLAGGLLGMAHVPVPFVEPAILASVVALGLLVALAVDLPVWLGGLVIGAFALFHGHAHGTEAAAGLSGLEYIAGFALATAALHLAGIAAGIGLARLDYRSMTRAAGAACAALGVAMIAGAL
ncbi:HupE/UreJ family protein [Propylenella binzhouense]|uniref:HupE/UreJ family protein n=1 Tax=Propylenella binzhouense TaxID=2555902 RepID=A0A964T7A0_9HYPH|nr:HupE/UreJ family protein [Propylenella binzhouense]MYZ49798.1 HupE/UreJ family protein [Propylenella binzhouense]